MLEPVFMQNICFVVSQNLATGLVNHLYSGFAVEGDQNHPGNFHTAGDMIIAGCVQMCQLLSLVTPCRESATGNHTQVFLIVVVDKVLVDLYRYLFAPRIVIQGVMAGGLVVPVCLPACVPLIHAEVMVNLGKMHLQQFFAGKIQSIAGGTINRVNAGFLINHESGFGNQLNQLLGQVKALRHKGLFIIIVCKWAGLFAAVKIGA